MAGPSSGGEKRALLVGTVVAGPSSGGEKRALLVLVAWR